LRKPLVIRVLSGSVLGTAALVLVVFSVVNRHAVTVDFWPLDFAPEVRLFAVILGILAVGVLWGGIAAWLAGGARRRLGREAQRRVDKLEIELRMARSEIDRLKSDRPKRDGQGKPALPPADAA
jgi:uncharacterized integral membrane protein